LGVVAHDYTDEMLIEAGVEPDPNTGKIKAIPLSVVLDHKYIDGILDRLKVRMAVSGHSGNMQKGIHFDKTFSAAPNQHTARLLQALMVDNRWKRMSFDIKQAYIHAELPPGKLIALKYPEGFRRHLRDDKGELILDENGKPIETKMLLLRNLYGHPAASRAWSQTRDSFIMSEFNDNKEMPGYEVHKCIMDPCLFRYTKGDDEVLMLIHSDDCDMIGSSTEMMKEIMSRFDKKWGCKVVESDFMLGVKRVMKNDPSKEDYKPDLPVTVELTMTAYIDGVCESFKEELEGFHRKHVSTPFPEKTFISKDKSSITKEEADLYMGKGYQRLCGCLLWAARNVFPECQVGCSFLCRLMSHPSKQAWDAAIHMLTWLKEQRERGIKFSSDLNNVPIGFSDASNQSDPHDGLCQAGFCIMFKGGPVVYQSKKLKHCSPSGAASHVEYMALGDCGKAVIWLRQLLAEVHMDDLIMEPTIIFGDNDTANKLVKEDFISTGNQYIYLPYHFIKEIDALGICDVQAKRTAFNLADIFTKPVDVGVVNRLFAKLLGYDDFRNEVIVEKKKKVM